MKYEYRLSEPLLWTVGFYDDIGNWNPESDHNDKQEAAKRVILLNGGSIEEEPCRWKIAARVMGGFAAKANINIYDSELAAGQAVQWADALIEELKKKK